MSKRSREGPVPVSSKRPCLTFGQPRTVPSSKRKWEGVEEVNKAFRRGGVEEVNKAFRRGGVLQEQSIGRKRSAECFDEELNRLEKRMRATVPTAEEAIAFLLPHIIRLRNMYAESQQKVSELTRNNQLIHKTCTYLIREKRKVESELAMANCRFAMSGSKPFAVESRA